MAKSRNKRFVVVSDSHGDMIDPKAAAAALRWIKGYKPDVTIHAGDYADLRPLRKGASDEEKQGGMIRDVDACIDFLGKLKPNVVLEGNHDFRLRRAVDGANKVTAEYAGLLLKQLSELFDDLKVCWKPYDKRRGVYALSPEFNVIHGYHSGIYAGRQSASIYGSCILGHVHRVEDISWPHYTGPKRGVICGCLAFTDMEYNAAQPNTLAQQQGFAYGEIAPNGKTIVRTARIDDGQVYA